MSAKVISRIAVMSALCFVLRLAFSSLPNVQPVTAIFLVYLLCYGLAEAVLLMGLCMLLTSFILGFGPWVFWQISAFAIILLVWKVLLYPLSKKVVRYDLLIQSLMAAFCGLAYGFLIDAAFAYLYSMPWWTYLLAGMPFNLAHAVSTFVFYPLILLLFRRISNEKRI
ncbi:ECF transporter S component [Streptococcus ictaluri]|uniref:ECF transporter S component n=1 Tax=Streptococcus ictaluri 707-05 TaxID=764299 RepID=G5K279_9STRE|nr:ECF transporter S component [Streptococcus ictaluri]EHI70194.1 hypothetical protein STRIC_2488 [Streptococcus ictaluri 707-05]